MNKLPFLSIIIPAYNAANTIERLIVVLENQDFDDYELIIVNDGSTDSTESIVRGCTRKYSNITIISQINKGVSSARNTGMKQANGEYLLFLDSDDEISDVLLKTVFQKAKLGRFKDDLIVFGKENVDSTGKIVSVNIVPDTDSTKINAKIFDEILKNNLLPTMYNKVVKRTFVSKLQFKKLTVGEDFQFVLDLIERIPTISMISATLYAYDLESSGSIMQSYNQDRLKNFMNQKSQIETIITKLSSSEIEKASVLENTYLDTLDRITTNVFRKNGGLSYKKKYQELLKARDTFRVQASLVQKNYSGIKRIKMFLVVKCNPITFIILNGLYKIR